MRPKKRPLTGRNTSVLVQVKQTLVIKYLEPADSINMFYSSLGARRQNFHPHCVPSSQLRYLVCPAVFTTLIPFSCLVRNGSEYLTHSADEPPENVKCGVFHCGPFRHLDHLDI